MNKEVAVMTDTPWKFSNSKFVSENFGEKRYDAAVMDMQRGKPHALVLTKKDKRVIGHSNQGISVATAGIQGGLIIISAATMLTWFWPGLIALVATVVFPWIIANKVWQHELNKALEPVHRWTTISLNEVKKMEKDLHFLQTSRVWNDSVTYPMVDRFDLDTMRNEITQFAQRVDYDLFNYYWDKEGDWKNCPKYIKLCEMVKKLDEAVETVKDLEKNEEFLTIDTSNDIMKALDGSITQNKELLSNLQKISEKYTKELA